jgi:hypothetical protein
LIKTCLDIPALDISIPASLLSAHLKLMNES